MIYRKSVIIIFLFPMNISPLVNLSDGLRVCLGMCSYIVHAGGRQVKVIPLSLFSKFLQVLYGLCYAT